MLIKNRGVILKEIGEQFKEKREEIGITIEEVVNDLNVDAILIENLESGNTKVFKDILEVKDIISIYAKYLGLDEEEILEDYNDYLFEKTSKISLDDIKQSLEKNKVKEKKIKSPYTLEMEDDSKKNIVMIVIVLLVILVFLYFVLKQLIVG